MWWRFVAACGLVLLFVDPAYAAGWETSNGLVQGDCVQFDWRGGLASASFSTSVQITVDNTIANKIGYDGEVVDEWALTAGEVVAGDRVKGVFSFVVASNVPVTVSGKDLGFWAGWYGPRFCFTPIADPVPVVTAEPTSEPTLEPTVEPTSEPTPEPTPEPSPEPTVIVAPEPTPAPPVETPSPTPTATVEPTPTPTPSVKPSTPEPTATPSIEPTVEATTQPTIEPSVEPTVEPTSEPTITPAVITEVTAEQRAELMTEAIADDPQLPEALAAIPVLGNVAETVLQAFNAIGNIGADMTTEERHQAKRVVLASVIASNTIATTTIRTRTA